jgi:hypothetical protein
MITPKMSAPTIAIRKIAPNRLPPPLEPEWLS